MKLTIGKKILYRCGFAMLITAVTGIAIYKSGKQLDEANDRVAHTYVVIGEIGSIRTSLLRLENAGRGYVLTGDERYLGPGDGFRSSLATSLKSLRTLTADNPAQQRRLETLDTAVERKLTEMLQIAAARREKGFAPAVAAMQQMESVERVSETRNSLAALEDEERTLLTERERIAQAGGQTANLIIVYGTLIGLGLAAILGIVTYFAVTGPLAEFQKIVTSAGEGDLTLKIVRDGEDEFGRLAGGINRMVTRLRNMTMQTRAVTENLNSAAMDILASAKQQSALIGQQVAAYQETNATMQQVSKSCLQIAERAKQVTAAAETVSLANTSGLDAVQKTNQSVEAIHEQAEAVAQNIVSLSEKTQAVGDILATVNDIAEQSHLLALNAAIEAAAAGEHGRSFSVVAGEIKNLADQSKAATVQVKTILGDIQKEINTSVMLTEEAVKRVDLGKHQADMAASAIRSLAANIDESVQAFQQIAAGTNQQQIGFENVMQAMKDLNRGSEQAASSTRETEKSAANLSDLGTQLGAATEGYRL